MSLQKVKQRQITLSIGPKDHNGQAYQGREGLPASVVLQCSAAATCRDLVRQETGASCMKQVF